MRSRSNIGIIAMAAAMSMGVAAAATEPVSFLTDWQPRYRGKGKPAKRRPKPNRNHISRRVRRKHRRAQRQA